MNSKIRLFFQIIILVLVIWSIYTAGDFEAYCPMGGILGLGTKLHQGTLPCSMSSAAIFKALVLFIGALAIGKLFCGYICPVGSITEWFGKIGKKLKIQFRLPQIVDRALRSLKYFLLFIVLYYTITSSELFCRKFDPYYGAATGFGHDTVLLWSIAAVVVTILGSLFVKQFWCRYLCFLGAASNVFVNIWGAIAVFVVYFILSLLGIHLPFLWLVAGLAMVGFMLEIGFFKKIPFPFFKITVDDNKCTHCGLCSKTCPYDIPVDKYQKVTHPDCVMCTECITSCKKEQAVGINGRLNLKYLPLILVVILIGLGLSLSGKYEFTTLEQRWGTFDQIEQVSEHQQTGLKNVKCFGSANSLYSYLSTIPGIYGLDAYASSHTVTIYYDSTEISKDDVKQTLFSSSRFKTRSFENYTPDTLTIWKVGIENLFDSIDQANLNAALFQNKFVFGMETFYGEPVTAKIYFDSDSTFIKDIKEVIHQKQYAEQIDGEQVITEIDFLCESEGKIIGEIDAAKFRNLMFESYDLEFNDYETTGIQKINIFEIGMPNADDAEIVENLPYLVSSLSSENGILRVRTNLTDRYVLQIFFNKEKLHPEKIERILFADTLTYFVDENTVGTVANQFQFERDWEIIEESEITINNK
jgi:polyferredoxin